MSEERRLAVLRAIVQDYVETSEPVGSKALLERHQLGVSAATVRNDMAALEEEGLIAAPHTSAGRVPTDAGYRCYVDMLLDSRRSAKDVSAVEARLRHEVGDECIGLFLQLGFLVVSHRHQTGSLFSRNDRHRIGRGQFKFGRGGGLGLGFGHGSSRHAVLAT